MNAIIRSQAIALAQAVVTEFRPSPKVPTADWMEEHAVLENGGRWRMWKPQRQIAEAFDDPRTRKIVVKASARVGKTQTLKGLLLRGVARGLSVGLVQARRDDAADFSASTFSPAAAKCRPVAALMRRQQKAKGKIARLTGNESRDSQLSKTFTNGASVRFLSAESPADARRISLDWLLLDESSAYAAALGDEGDPIRLFEKRLGASYRPLTVITSTPRGEDCHVSREYELSDKRRYFVPCPHCGESQTLEFERLAITTENHGTRFVCDLAQDDLKTLQALPEGWGVEYVCRSGCVIEAVDQRRMFEHEDAGFRPTATAAVPGTVGFEFNALISRFESASWKNVAVEAMTAKGKPELEATFWNTTLGRSYSLSVDKNLNTELLREFATDAFTAEGRIAADILQLVAGVDVQSDRVEVTVLGRRVDSEGNAQQVIVDHRKIYGDPTDPALWADLQDFVQRELPHELGGKISIDAVAVDSGNWATQVYEACHAPGRRNWYAIKGRGGSGLPLWRQSSSQARWQGGSGKLYIIGVDSGKQALVQHLNAAPGQRRFGIARHLCEDSDYLGQLLAEERIIEPGGRNKRAKMVWRRKAGLRAESLDCYVYACAALYAAGDYDWSARRDELTVESPTGSIFGFLGAKAANLAEGGEDWQTPPSSFFANDVRF